MYVWWSVVYPNRFDSRKVHTGTTKRDEINNSVQISTRQSRYLCTHTLKKESLQGRKSTDHNLVLSPYWNISHLDCASYQAFSMFYFALSTYYSIIPSDQVPHPDLYCRTSLSTVPLLGEEWGGWGRIFSLVLKVIPHGSAAEIEIHSNISLPFCGITL